MYCRNCGNKLNENDTFCGNCGYKLNMPIQDSYVREKNIFKAYLNFWKNSFNYHGKVDFIEFILDLVFNLVVVELIFWSYLFTRNTFGLSVYVNGGIAVFYMALSFIPCISLIARLNNYNKRK